MKRRNWLALAAAPVALILALLVSTWIFAGPVFAGMPSGSLASVPAAGNDKQAAPPEVSKPTANGITVGQSYKNDLSAPVRDYKVIPVKPQVEKEANENPSVRVQHKDAADPVVQRIVGPLAMPTPILNFDGIGFPGVACNCAPPDTNGEVGATQYVQMVNEGVQVFNKTTGASVLGPVGITTFWSGFGGVCETAGDGDPVVLYDQFANRWIITQFAGSGIPTDECIAVSTTSDATGAYNRYGFHLGSNFYDYPHLSVWPDGYYMSDNVFNSGGTAFLGAQGFAFDRAKMLVGQPATFQAGPLLDPNTVPPILPSDVDGSTLPPTGAPNHFVTFPYGSPSAMHIFNYHVDFTTPGNSTFLDSATIPVAAYTELCPTTRNCIPQQGSTTNLDGIGDRPMFRAAYRNYGDHEAMVVNHSVNAATTGTQAGVRWYEIRGLAGAPTLFQQGTYAPDTTNRWMGSVAMDHVGNLAVGYSASSTAIFPQLRYAGRLANDPIGQLSQGEATLFAGTGSQTGTGSRWGDYSDLTIDPVDDCTFYYTNEYYATTSQFNWKTRIGSFKFPGCSIGTATPTVTGTLPTSTPTQTASNTATATATACGNGANYAIATATGTIVPGTGLVAGSQADDVTAPIALPFPFALYGTSYTSLAASTNGNLQFTTTNTAYSNNCLPSTTITGPTIFGFWDDLIMTPAAGTGLGIYTSTTGTAPNRIFNIEYRACKYNAGACGGPVSFEVRLYEAGPTTNQRFDIVYGTATDAGTSATVGVQNTGTQFTQFECNTGGITAGLMLTFTLPPCGTALPTGTSTATSTGTLPTSTRTVTATQTGVATRTTTSTQTPVATATATTICGTVINEGFETGLGVFTSSVGTCAPGGCGWSSVTTAAHTGTHSAFAPDLGGVSDQYLSLTTAVNVPASGGIMTFWHKYTLESGFDGGVLETSIDGGTTWVDAGPNITSGGYDRAISSSFQSPISGRMAWTGTHAAFTQVSVNLNPYSGQSLKVRFREANDSSVGAAGWFVDDVQVSFPANCGTATSTITGTPPTSTRTITATASPTGGATCPPSITQSSSTAITSGNSVACGVAGSYTDDNYYYRLFPLQQFLPPSAGAYMVQSVDVGIETSTGTQPLRVTLYNSSANPPTLASLGPPLGQATVQVSAQSATLLNIPVNGTIPANGNLVVEVFSASGEVAGTTFYIGSNTAPETGPSYLRAPACGITDIASVSSIGFPNMHIVMRVNGGCGTGSVTATAVASSTTTRTSTAVATGTSTSVATRTSTAVASGTSTSVATGTSIGTGTVGSTITAVATFTPAATNTSQPTSTTVPPTACPIQFQDVLSDNTFYPYVRCLACRGILGGYPCGGTGEPCGTTNNPYFRPGVSISRGQIAKIVSQSAGFNEAPGTQIYEDVPTASPFYQYINRLSNRGYIGGYPCGQLPSETCITPNNRPYFRPSSNATRGQLSKIVATAAMITDPVSGQIYTDVGTDSPFYKWIQQLSARGVMSGYPCGGAGEPCDSQNRPYFRPNADVSRGQASKIVANTFFPNCNTPAQPVVQFSTNK